MLTIGRYQITIAYRWTWGYAEGVWNYIDNAPSYCEWCLGPVTVRRYVK